MIIKVLFLNLLQLLYYFEINMVILELNLFSWRNILSKKMI